MNDDLPCTATTGFGFNLQKFRPVGNVEIVKNLGLRPNPVPVVCIEALFSPFHPQIYYFRMQTKQIQERTPNRTRSRNLRYQRRAIDLGLGIVTRRSMMSTSASNNQTPDSSSFPTHSCNPTPYSRSDYFSDTPSTVGSSPASSSDTTSTSSESSSYHQANNITNPFKTMNSNTPQIAVLIPLPPQTPSEVSLLAAPTTPTLMEESESDGHFFGAEPLEVENGVAVMEEGVGLHVPDVLITQY